MATQLLPYEVRFVNGCAHIAPVTESNPGLTLATFDINIYEEVTQERQLAALEHTIHTKPANWNPEDDSPAIPIEFLGDITSSTFIGNSFCYLENPYISSKDIKMQKLLDKITMIGISMDSCYEHNGKFSEIAPKHQKRYDYLHNEYKKLCLEYDNFDTTDHKALMTPSSKLNEGIYGISEHLGEGYRKTRPVFNERLNPVRHLPLKSPGLTNLEKIIYYEAHMTAQGEPCLPHEDRSRRPWFKTTAGIIKRYGCTAEQADLLLESFRIIEPTPEMIQKFDKWIKKSSFESGLRYFENLAIQLVLVTDEGNPILDLIRYDADEDPDGNVDDFGPDNPLPIKVIISEGHHKLDDPRDDEPRWEDKQPNEFKKVLAMIRGSKKLDDLKIFGTSLFNDKQFNKNQTSVIWWTYNQMKDKLSPRLRPIATKLLTRLACQDVKLSKAKYWLYNEGKSVLKPHELSVLWKAIKQIEGIKAPKQENFDIPIPEYNIPEDYSLDYEPITD